MFMVFVVPVCTIIHPSDTYSISFITWSVANPLKEVTTTSKLTVRIHTERNINRTNPKRLEILRHLNTEYRKIPLYTEDGVREREREKKRRDPRVNVLTIL